MTKVKRGVVIGGACDIKREGESETFRAADIDRGLINTSLLYWDRIDIPDSTLISVYLPSDMNVLEQEGVLSRRQIPFNVPFRFGRLSTGSVISLGGGFNINGQKVNVADVVNAAPMQAFNELVLDKTTDWAFIQSGAREAQYLNNSEVDKKSVLMFELYDALPVPDIDTPYEKILEFKNKRQNELIALRIEIDEAYQRIVNSQDIEHAQSLEFIKLTKAISDLQKCSDETWKSRLKKALKFELSPMSMIGASIVAENLFQGSFIAKAGFGMLSMVKINLNELAADKKISERSVPYKYVLEGVKELDLK